MEIGLSGFDEVDILGVLEKVVVVVVIFKVIFDCLCIIVQVMCYGFINDEIQVIILFDFWFLNCICEIIEVEEEVCKNGLFVIEEGLCKFKMMGFIDVCLVKLIGCDEDNVCCVCQNLNVVVLFKCIDICVVEFEV